MKKTLIAFAAAATIAAGTLNPTTADARCRGCAVGLGVLGGLAAGAIIGGAIANSQPRYYAPAPGYVVYDGYGRRIRSPARAVIGRVGRCVRPTASRRLEPPRFICP